MQNENRDSQNGSQHANQPRLLGLGGGGAGAGKGAGRGAGGRAVSSLGTVQSRMLKSGLDG